MFLKVLLVDDEPLARGYIRSLINWESNGFFICGEASDGFDALAKMEQMQPDIVMLDVSMPGMDGVTLSKQIMSRYKSSKIIALSSYDNYDYVREVMKNGAVDYLLKHRLDVDMMLHTLEKAKEMIGEEVRKCEQEKRLAQEKEIFSPAMTRNYLKELVLGNKDNFSMMEEYFRSLDISTDKGSIIIGVMQINCFDLITYRYNDNKKDHLVKSIIDLCNQIIQSDTKGYVTYIEQGRFALLFYYIGNSGVGSIQNRVYDFKNRMENSLQLFLDLQTTFGFSPICSRMNSIDRFYQMACNELEQKTAANDLFDEAGNQDTLTDHCVSLSSNQEKQLLTAIETGNNGLSDLVIEEIFHVLQSRSPMSKGVQIVVKELLDVAFKVASKAGFDLGLIDSMGAGKRLGYGSLMEIKSGIKDLYKTLSEEIHRINYHSYSRYVQQAIDYIHQYYPEEITLEKTAKEIGITYTYLSKLFKEETGISFTEYLNKVRIEMSKKFMDDGKGIKEIYSNVGFNNYSYFFKVFKEVVGRTPLEYMKKKNR